jgi:hypothetical protein
MTLSRLRLKQARWVVASILLSTLVATAQTDSVRARITEAVDVERVVTLRGNTHPLARPEFDGGTAPDSLPARRMMLVLSRAPEQETALRKLLDEQQITSSANYHRWLTPQEFGQQFGPADSDIQAVTDWLTSQGFQVNRVTAGRTVIEFSGTAGQVRQSMHTEIHKFEVKGKEYWANASDPQIPYALSPVVSSVVSLNSFPRQSMSRRLGTFSRSKVTGEVRPLFTYTDNFGTNYAVGPGDFATIYNVPTAFDGTGVSIAIVANSNINPQDVKDFRTMFGLPANDPQIVLDGPDPGLNFFTEGEADLDVQWAGAVAKNATIKMVASEDTETSSGVDLSALYIVDNNIASILSDSFGNCEQVLGVGGNTFYNALWQQSAAQGITVFVAAGDNGSATCDGSPENAATLGLAVDGLASTPYDVAVGGTDFNDGNNPTVYWNSTNSSPTQISAKSYIPETTWNDSCARTAITGVLTTCPSVSSSGDDLVGGSGGPSAVYAKPSWQTGSGVPNDGVRDLPDISLFAGRGFIQNFYVYCQADANASSGGSSTSCDLNSPFQDFQGAGGTSFGAPAFAGIMALVNQKTGARQGNANYVLYPLAAQANASCASNAAMAAGASASTCIFYDTVTGNISVACRGGTPNCSNTSKAANQFGVLVDPNHPTTPAWTTTPGYDLATGLGSVNVTNLVNKWASVPFSPTTTTLVSVTPTTITHGQPATVTIHVTSGSGTPTGPVTLMSGSNSPLGIPAFDLSGGTFIGTTTFLPGGTYNVTAHYAGDGTFGASDSTPPGFQVTVSKEPSQAHLGLVTFDQNGNITSTNATTTAYGSPYILRLDVTNASGLGCAPSGLSLVYPCSTGTVTFTDNSLPLVDFNGSNTATVNSQGYAEDYFIQLPTGTHHLQATYGGDSSFTSSTSSVNQVVITKAATTMTLSASDATVQTGASVILTATISTQSNSAVPPAGSVQFLNGSTPVSGTVTYVGTPYSNTTGAFASLQATVTTTFSTAANIIITSIYSGNTNYSASPSNPTISITVTAPPPDFTFTASPTSFNIASPGQSGNTTLTVGSTNGFTGTVNFTCAVPATMKEAACSLAPTSLTTSGTTVLTVTTTAPHTVGSLFNPDAWFMLGGGTLLAGLLLLSIPVKRRRLKLAFGLMCVVLLTAGAFGCGGGSSGGGPTTDPGTAAGTYSVSVTATSGATVHTTNVSVTVQ